LVYHNEDRLPTAEAAAVVQAKPRTLEKWRLFETGPPFEKVGSKLVVYRYGDLIAWLESRKRGSRH
jgi:hypothetical protein